MFEWIGGMKRKIKESKIVCCLRRQFDAWGLAQFLSLAMLFYSVETGASSVPLLDLQEPLRLAVEDLIKQPPGQNSAGLHSLQALQLLYERNGFQPIWLDKGIPSTQVNELIEAVEDARKDGLNPDDYHIESIKGKLAESINGRLLNNSSNLQQMLALELVLSDAFLLYGSHLLAGRINPESIDPEWSANRLGIDMSLVLEKAILSGQIKNSLVQLAPSQQGYKRLRKAFEIYKNLKTSWDFSSFPASTIIKKGSAGAIITELRKRLAVEGFLSETVENESAIFDEELEQAVRNFQTRYGLKVDGVVGPQTLSNLAVSIEDRIVQIEINMERWRWLPQTLGERHVLVNIADYRLEAFADQARVLEMKAIVGREYRRTPVFSDRISYLVLNPSWNIPRSIAVKDKLPLIKKNPEYLKEQNIRVFKGWGDDRQEIAVNSIDWSSVQAKGFPYSLRQEPGPQNALGRIKFMFPNKYNVYLHDTPSRELFNSSLRTFSSGCVRIEKPIELAAHFLLRNTQWSYETLEETIEKGIERTIKLSDPVPVHLLYWTVFTDDAGNIQFRPDVYGRDKLLKEAWLDRPHD